MSGVAIVEQIVSILTAGIVSLGQGIGQGLSALVNAIFFVTVEGTTTMSTFGILVVVFAGVSLCIGLCRLVVRWLSTLGGSRM